MLRDLLLRFFFLSRLRSRSRSRRFFDLLLAERLLDLDRDLRFDLLSARRVALRLLERRDFFLGVGDLDLDRLTDGLRDVDFTFFTSGVTLLRLDFLIEPERERCRLRLFLRLLSLERDLRLSLDRDFDL